MERPLHIALLGCGNMGGAILKSWLKNLNQEYTYTCITPLEEEVTGFLSHSNVGWCEAGKPLPQEPDILLIAVKPQLLEVALKPYTDYTKTLYFSIVAGKMIEAYRSFLPTQKLVRLMPNTPAAVGEGMTSAYTNDPLTEGEKSITNTLLESFGKLLWLEDEGHFHAVTAVAGSGPAYVFLLAEALTQAGIAQGLPQDLAATLARQTVVGSGVYLGASSESPETLRVQVTSPGGTTEAALSVLLDKLPDLMAQAIQKACDRSKELG